MIAGARTFTPPRVHARKHIARRSCYARRVSGPAKTEILQLDRPPPRAARIALPVDFGRRFAIFADAEEEFDWTQPFRRDAPRTTAIAALTEANARFAARGVAPTYLVDWPVTDTPASAAVLRGIVDQDAGDIGTQLHPWVNPPFEERVGNRTSYLGNLSTSLQRAKLAALTERIEQVFGARPLAYRAGRYGIGPHTARQLADAGYRLDVSVRALFDYRAQHGPDFRGHPIWPYRVGGGLYELPLTAANIGPLRFLPALTGTRLAPLVGRVPLTPEGTPLVEARAAIARLLDRDHRLFSLSFHTPSVVPGHTPYVRDQADLTAFWRWWDGVFDTFAGAGVTPVRSGEIIAACEAAA